jgi:TolB-like protein/Flp pilus assembly protein TadD/tRNA A-37 threonylcarbamoyl transferase component Bud32
MGAVYRAMDVALARAVAIKVLPHQLASNETAKARFVREARAASALDHPNIGTIYEIGEQDGELFIAMALYEGQTLKKRLEEGALPLSEAVDVLRQMSKGLEAAHNAGIVHRDIKPANVMLTSAGVLKILDFGLAKLAVDSAAQAVTQTGEAMGTLLYMSPEQLKGEAVDKRSDLWSLGVVGYEMLAGVCPFRAESSVATAMRILGEEPPLLSNVATVPSGLAAVISQLLQKDPAKRLGSASEVISQLEKQLAYPAVAVTGQRAIRLALLLVGIAVLSVASGLFYYFVRGGARSVSTEVSNSASSVSSIAVLPFTSLTSGEENAYFAQGFHDELLRQLGRIGDLRVISRTSVMQYKEGVRNLREIAEALGVSSIVEGSVQRAENRVRVEARLIDARNDRQIWGDRYDRDVTDVFGIQTAVAEEIARTLQARISPSQKAQIERKPTQKAEAYDLYLRALEYANRPGPQPDNLEIAERLYRQAIQADPSFALARARLAYVRLATYWGVAGALDSVVEEAKQEAELSLRLQPDLPEGHLALGYYHYWGRLDYDRALKEFEVARSGVPAEAVNAIGFALRRQGRFDEAIRYQQEAVHLDPGSPHTREQLAESFIHTRRYEDGDRLLDQVLTIAPDFTAALMEKAFVQEAWKGETSLAKKVIREARGRLDPQGRVGAQDWIISLLSHNPREALPFLDSLDSDSIKGSEGVLPKAFLYAVAHEALGNADQARKGWETALPLLAAEVEKNPSRPFQRSLLAHSYAGLGRKEDALREVNRAVEILPISKDHGRGTSIEIERAVVEARVGQTEAAIEHIRYLLSIPCLLSPGLLRVDPRWAPLRGDLRFRQLAELGREPASAAGRKSVAVLPFVNMSSDKESEYFSDGVTEEVINALANVDGLRVASRMSAFAFKGKDVDIRQIGEKLNVGAVLEGTVRRDGDRLRITAQLTNVADDYHVWSKTYDRELKNIFAVEEELARSIAQALRPKLVRAEAVPLVKAGTANLAAHDLYLMGRYFWNKRTKEMLTKAINYFHQAIEQDPSYALAYVGLADSTIILAEYGSTSVAEALPKAKQAAHRALELDESLAELHEVLGVISVFDYEWSAAEQQLRRAIEIKPEYPSAHHRYAVLLTTLGRLKEAKAEAERVRQLAPTSPIINNVLTATFVASHEYDRAIEQAKKAIELAPGFPQPRVLLAVAYIGQGRDVDAVVELEKLGPSAGLAAGFAGAVGYAYAMSGRRAEALRVLSELNGRSENEYVPPSARALIYVGLGDKDQAFAWLDKAYADRDFRLRELKTSPIFDSLRSDPRFTQLLKRMHFDDR